MTQAAGTLCPKGHSSTEADYCSECGAKIGGSSASSEGGRRAVSGAAGTGLCPDCGTVQESAGAVFCEVCGYNFQTGAHGEVAVAEPPPGASPDAVEASEPSAVPALADPSPDAGVPAQHWTIEVSVDPALRAAESPEPPAGVVPFTLSVAQPVSLVGRRNEARAIFPEISLDHDEAVSRRHALLQLDAQKGLLLRDIGAANGTRLNGTDLQPMTDYPLHDGDQITLGHWSRLSVHAG